MITFRVKFYHEDRCWGVEHGQSAADAAVLIETWGNLPDTESEHIVIEVEA